MSPNSDDSQREHPDELTLSGWSEGRLLPFEREAVEAHLAECRACRDLLGSLELEVAEPTEEVAEQAVPDPPAVGKVLPWKRWLAAAAALLLAFTLLKDRGATPPTSAFELSLGASREATFGTLRGAPVPEGELFVGLRLVEPGWVRLIAVDEQGEVYQVPLDPDGATTGSFAGASDHVFGPYPTSFGEGRSVQAVVALVSDRELDWAAIKATSWRGELRAEWIQSLGDDLGATARVQLLR